MDDLLRQIVILNREGYGVLIVPGGGGPQTHQVILTNLVGKRLQDMLVNDSKKIVQALAVLEGRARLEKGERRP